MHLDAVFIQVNCMIYIVFMLSYARVALIRNKRHVQITQ